MPTDLKNIKKQFEKSIMNYDRNATVQNIMAEKMIEQLKVFNTDFSYILELGAGSGLLTKQIKHNLKFKEFYANDIVEKSKICVEKYVPDVKFILGNSLKIKTSKKFDLIISNAMFQWFENLEKAIEKIKFLNSENGILAFSTFSPKNFCEITEITGLSLNYKNKSEIKQILEKCEFEILYIEEFKEILEFNTPLEILAHMKKTGVNSLSTKKWSIKNVKDFCKKYNDKFQTPQLTYAPIIVICKKK